MKLIAYITVALSIFLYACGNTDYKENTNETEKKVPQDENKFITNSILGYYVPESNQDDTDPLDMVMRIDSNHHDNEFEFLNGIELKLIDPQDSLFFVHLNVIPFPKDFIKGDLNDDGKDDYVVPVYATGGGSAEWRDIFVFISTKDSIQLFKMMSSFDLAQCKDKGSHNGQFYPNKITDGLLTGEVYCYTDSDPHCCPSIKKVVEYRFSNGFILAKESVAK
jgi:hypothetical protein